MPLKSSVSARELNVRMCFWLLRSRRGKYNFTSHKRISRIGKCRANKFTTGPGRAGVSSTCLDFYDERRDC